MGSSDLSPEDLSAYIKSQNSEARMRVPIRNGAGNWWESIYQTPSSGLLTPIVSNSHKTPQGRNYHNHFIDQDNNRDWDSNPVQTRESLLFLLTHTHGRDGVGKCKRGVGNSTPFGGQEVLEQSKSVKTQGHTYVAKGLTIVPQGHALTRVCVCHLSWYVHGCFSVSVGVAVCSSEALSIHSALVACWCYTSTKCKTFRD